MMTAIMAQTITMAEPAPLSPPDGESVVVAI